MSNPVRSGHRTRGFSLLEVVVALLLSVVVTLGLLQSIAAAARAHRLAQRALDSTIERWNLSRELWEGLEQDFWNPAAGLVRWDDPVSVVVVDPRIGPVDSSE